LLTLMLDVYPNNAADATSRRSRGGRSQAGALAITPTGMLEQRVTRAHRA
jgi:hypothetical protein